MNSNIAALLFAIVSIGGMTTSGLWMTQTANAQLPVDVGDILEDVGIIEEEEEVEAADADEEATQDIDQEVSQPIDQDIDQDQDADIDQEEENDQRNTNTQVQDNDVDQDLTASIDDGDDSATSKAESESEDAKAVSKDHGDHDGASATSESDADSEAENENEIEATNFAETHNSQSQDVNQQNFNEFGDDTASIDQDQDAANVAIPIAVPIAVNALEEAVEVPENVTGGEEEDTFTVCVGQGAGTTQEVTAAEFNQLLESGERVRLGACPSGT